MVYAKKSGRGLVATGKWGRLLAVADHMGRVGHPAPLTSCPGLRRVSPRISRCPQVPKYQTASSQPVTSKAGVNPSRRALLYPLQLTMQASSPTQPSPLHCPVPCPIISAATREHGRRRPRSPGVRSADGICWIQKNKVARTVLHSAVHPRPRAGCQGRITDAPDIRMYGNPWQTSSISSSHGMYLQPHRVRRRQPKCPRTLRTSLMSAYSTACRKPQTTRSTSRTLHGNPTSLVAHA